MTYRILSAKKIILLLLLLISQTTSPVFGQERKVKLNEMFILQSGETAKVEGAKLTITLLGVGRTISESGEVEYVELQISTSKIKQTIIISERGNKTKSVGGYAINLLGAESFGKTHCRLKISRKK